jgi:hypothetical protein
MVLFSINRMLRRGKRRHCRRLVGALALVGLAGAVASAVLSADPRTLPDAALGSDAVLIAERAAVFYVLYLFALVVVIQAFKGSLPVLRGITRFESVLPPAKRREADEARRPASQVREIPV